MRQILNIDLENQRVVVQPGVINNWVTQAVSGAGFYYAPDLQSNHLLNWRQRSGELRRRPLKYGVTTNHVLGLKLCFPMAQLWMWGQIPEMPGYDLTGVFVGSEGTLGTPRKLPCEFSKHLNQFVFFWQTLPALRQLGQLFPTSSALELSQLGWR